MLLRSSIRHLLMSLDILTIFQAPEAVRSRAHMAAYFFTNVQLDKLSESLQVLLRSFYFLLSCPKGYSKA